MTAHDHPGIIREGVDRFAAPMFFLNGRFDIKVSGSDTDGQMCIIDTWRDVIGGPPLHYHKFQDEWFMVLQGEFLFQVGNKLVHAYAGDSVFGPRQVPHSFRCLTVPSRMLLVFQPALGIEDFFRSGVKLDQSETSLFDELSLRHDIVNIGPPLRDEQLEDAAKQGASSILCADVS